MYPNLCEALNAENCGDVTGTRDVVNQVQLFGYLFAIFIVTTLAVTGQVVYQHEAPSHSDHVLHYS